MFEICRFKQRNDSYLWIFTVSDGAFPAEHGFWMGIIEPPSMIESR